MYLLKTCRVPCSISAPLQAIELRGLGDALSQACSGVIYSRVEVNNGYAVILIMARTSVALIKSISILRHELNTAHLLSKLIFLVKK